MWKISVSIWYFLLTVTTLGQQAKPLSCTGRIVNTEGQPISKAKVVLYYYHTRWGMGNHVAQETESGADGMFTFKESLKYGDAKQYPYGRDSYVLLTSHPDYAFGWKKIDRNQEQARYDIVLTEPKSQTITVTDHNGKPLAGASVWPYSVGNRADSEPIFRDYLSLPTFVGIVGSTTGPDGKATIKNLPKTRCSFHASLKGYATGLSFGGERPIRLSKGATVSGTILDEDGKPVENALVKFHTEWMWNFFLTRTDSDGKFRLEDLPAEGWDMGPWGNSANANGIYVITMEHEDYIASETQDQFKPGEIIEDFDIEAYRGTLIKCHVRDANTSLPVAGARIGGSNESGRIDGYSDANGVFTVRVMSGQASLFFHSPPEGVYVLRGNDPPESSLRFDAQGEEMTVHMKSPPIAGLLTSIKGRVLLPDGSPAADVKISTNNSEPYETLTFGGAGGAYTGTSSDGSFELKDVPVGLKLFLYGNTKNYKYILAEVIENVEDPTILSTPMVMQQGQIADVLLSDKQGKSCENLSVKIKPVMWGNRVFRADYHNARTDANGRLTINGIIPGMEYYVMDSRAESGPRDMYYTQTMTLIPLEPKIRKITSFEGVDIEFDINQAKDKILLVCFWDINQRPSRNCITQLAKQAEQLTQKGVSIAAIQVSEIDQNVLNEWIKKYNIPFPVGVVQGDAEKTCFAWGVKSLPWLILTDQKHIVEAAGFSLAELDEKI
jgi:protocatechuate 3,4-dioxygenase beta subunit